MITQVSCKLTNSLIYYLDKQGVALTPLFEMFDGPEEFLKDPHFWIDIHQVEKIFEKASHLSETPNIAQSVAIQIIDMQTWGALDSVFKLMPSPQDYFANLGRFFSYFLAPLDQFQELERGKTFVRFEFPIRRIEAPHTFDFLRTVLENLPRYSGHMPATSDHSEIKNEMWVSWDTAQPSLFYEEPRQVLNPRLMQNLMAMLETQQRTIETKNREMLQQRAEIERLRNELHTQVREKIYAEKMSGLAQLAAGVAHEINNPLSYVISNIDRFQDYFKRLEKGLQQLEAKLLAKDLKSGEAIQKIKNDLDLDFVFNETPQMLTEASDGLKRVKEIVKDLSSLAHPRTGRDEKKIPTDLNGVIDSLLKVFTEEIQDRIQVQKTFELKTPVKVFPVRMGQVFMNLISNAVHAIPEKGKIEVKTQQRNNEAVVEIVDNGVGMDIDVLNRAFTPFFTTKEVGKGTGLGLSIAQSIVEMHKGQINVISEKGKGSRFIVTLPLENTSQNGSMMHA